MESDGTRHNAPTDRAADADAADLWNQTVRPGATGHVPGRGRSRRSLLAAVEAGGGVVPGDAILTPANDPVVMAVTHPAVSFVGTLTGEQLPPLEGTE